MEPKNLSETSLGLNPEADVVNPETDQCSTISKLTENADKADLKKDAKPLKVTSTLKSKKSKHTPTSKMVLETIKSLKMRKGASAQDIGEFIGGHYEVSAKQMKPYVNRFLKIGVEKGILEQASGDGANGRFKIKKTEHVKVDKKPVEKDAKHLNVTSTLKRKKPKYPSTSKMVLEAIKSLKMRKGASAQDIGEFIEGHYDVSAKQMKPYVNRFLKTGVEKGILEEASGDGANGRFKIKKTEHVTGAKRNIKPNQKKRMKSNV